MKRQATHTLTLVIGGIIGLMLSGCAATGIERLSGPDFAAQAKQMELMSSSNWTTYIGTSAQRAYLEYGRPAFVGSGTRTTVFWTPLSELPEDIAQKLKQGTPPWKPWHSRTNKIGGGHMKSIETKRLLLRPFTADDWQDLQQVAIDWKAAPGPAFDKFPTEDEACRSFAQHLASRDNYLAMCLRASGKVVGLLAINGTDEEKQADLGHVILSKYQDDDHDREALQAMVQHCFDVKGIGSIITHNAPEHAAQVAPLKSLGFINTNPDDPGEFTLSKAQWEQIP
jgi:RimJ/RimL family protein N-acetyltransferase